MSITQREVSILLGVVVERRPSSHPWADWVWKPISVFLNAPQTDSWQVLRQEGDHVQYHAATLPLTLHRKETDALRENLILPQPEIYVVLQEDDEGEDVSPYFVDVVTASPFEAQDFLDAGDYLVEKVAMPDDVAAFVQAFVEEHHVDEEFIKRRRDKLKIEDQKFGKDPIFSSHTKH